MSRRAFIRWMLGLFVMIGAATTGLIYLLQRSVNSQSVAKHAAEQPVAVPEPAAPEAKPAPVPDKEPMLSFMILSDLHVSVYDPDTIKHLKEALDDIKKFESPVETVLLTGDLTDFGDPDGYNELQKVLSAYKLPPLYANMGNHDYYDIWIDKKGAFNKDTMPNGKTDWQARERFQKFFGLQKPYYAVEINGLPILMLSQEAYVQEKPEVGEGAWYSDDQLDWFKTELAKHKDGKPVFVMVHQPLPPIGSDGGSHTLIRAKLFREILKPYPNVFVFCGHRHQDFQNGTEHYVKETFHFFHNSSVGRVLNRNFQNEGKNKSQGLYVQVYKDRVTVRGREFSNRTWLKEADWNLKLT
ncbi:Calcineurin-like phosphoesterase [Paenibacillus sp. 1_12]|uniref:metallophosphoesterase family protein n=1 Tax=Paenibacillus sp. 1_12 TaxID=1566278 RepID=UPI0008E47982|nr:metallophosphoesterase [Paenibacillus sp. 1_12]SFM15358.1 Calcineurin-like phosphoesterase [Paenibacillus sp. 1_12]